MIDQPRVKVRYDYWKHIDDGRKYQASNVDEADYVEISIDPRTCGIIRFDRGADGKWPEYAMGRLRRMLQQAYEQGRGSKLAEVRQVLGF